MLTFLVPRPKRCASPDSAGVFPGCGGVQQWPCGVLVPDRSLTVVIQAMRVKIPDIVLRAQGARKIPRHQEKNLSPRSKPPAYSAHSPACPGPRACRSTLPCGGGSGIGAPAKRAPSVQGSGRASVTSSGRKSGAGKPTHPTWLKPTGSSTAAVCSTTSTTDPRTAGRPCRTILKEASRRLRRPAPGRFLRETSERKRCGDGGVCAFSPVFTNCSVDR